MSSDPVFITTKGFTVGKYKNDFELISNWGDLRRTVGAVITEARERAVKGSEVIVTVQVYPPGTFSGYRGEGE